MMISARKPALAVLKLFIRGNDLLEQIAEDEQATK